MSFRGTDMRREVVRELTAAGMSTRAIAPVVGVNNATVHRDLSGVADATPEQGHITGGYHPDPARPTPMRVNRETGEITDSPERSRPAAGEEQRAVRQCKRCVALRVANLASGNVNTRTHGQRRVDGERVARNQNWEGRARGGGCLYTGDAAIRSSYSPAWLCTRPS